MEGGILGKGLDGIVVIIIASYSSVFINHPLRLIEGI